MLRAFSLNVRLHVEVVRVHTQLLLVKNVRTFLFERTKFNKVLSICCLYVVAAVSCAERGVRSHLLLRGEQPEVLTGYNLVSTMYGNVEYVPRSKYANREEMLRTHADLVAGEDGSVLWAKDLEAIDGFSTSQAASSRKVLIVNEGAGDALALLGKQSNLVERTYQDLLFMCAFVLLCRYVSVSEVFVRRSFTWEEESCQVCS